LEFIQFGGHGEVGRKKAEIIPFQEIAKKAYRSRTGEKECVSGGWEERLPVKNLETEGEKADSIG